ncbi:iron ABC transporter permease [Phytomonospora endophytica]|uniref:Iron complex transport system permease protein n=1 Tax=Phytomonospora endophytica TaxID=714109 RepID=A0A841F747_9ACTN|nr:iron ABC transporter permease [Phytomonospora endophytica]MBB6032821.1 iron complex transport system permease protein [Phytomonospora endophytica]GIG66030.1 Fe3+-hydroxamate ABC transporter permease FhuB [Phytomonospora endophytica]
MSTLPTAHPGHPQLRGRLLWGAAALLALAGVAVVHLNQGAAGELTEAVLLGARLPRLLAGLVVGVALGVAGVLVQGVTRNPLASSDTLGVNAGAYLGVVVATVAVPVLPGLALLSGGLAAFVGGVAAMALVWTLTSRGPRTPGRVLLAGTAVSFAAGSIAALLLLLNEPLAGQLFFWGNGTLVQNSMTRPTVIGVIVVLAVAAAFALARPLDLLRLGDDAAEAMGVPVGRIRLAALGLAVLCAAAAVTVAGPISFVGLLAPIAVRRLGLRPHVWLIPFAGITGAALLLAADVAARLIAPPSAGAGELPVGILAALLGGPVFILLARKIVTGDEGGGAAVAVRGPMTRRAYTLLLAGGLLVFAAAVVIAVRVGEVHIAWSALLPWSGDDLAHDILGSRVPRVLVAALAGAMLAAAGSSVQAVVRNPLAEPQLLGITGGAAVGAVALITLAPGAPAEAIPLLAMAGGVLALGLVLLAARSKGGHLDPTRVILIGIGVAATCMALVDLLAVRAHMNISAALVWLSGSTYARGEDQVWWLVPGLLIVVALVWSARPLNMLALGEDLPRSLGLGLGRTRVLALTGGAVLAALTAGAIGAVGFVGLVAPHLARRVAGTDHRRLVPVSALFGATLLVVADTLGRSVLAPRGIPVGIVTALIGAPYLVWLLRRSGR